MQISTQYSFPAEASVVKKFPGLETDFEYARPKLKSCHESQQDLQLRNVDVNLFTFDDYRITSNFREFKGESPYKIYN